MIPGHFRLVNTEARDDHPPFWTRARRREFALPERLGIRSKVTSTRWSLRTCKLIYGGLNSSRRPISTKRTVVSSSSAVVVGRSKRFNSESLNWGTSKLHMVFCCIASSARP